MMKYWVLLSLISVSFSACQSGSKPEVHAPEKIEDLVLIEFAAKLEEDYHRLHPEAPTPADPHHP